VIYASDPDAAPDAAYVPGALELLVAGNRGRRLDQRRTPVTLLGVVPERAAFTLRIEAFEDAGAIWELALDEVERFQFEPGGERRDGAPLAALRERFARRLVVPADERARPRTLERVEEEREAAREWLRRAVDVAGAVERRAGEPWLFAALEAFMAARGVVDVERAFGQRWASNPRSGELVKGHAIVLAELGLCGYDGPVVRDAALFAGGWSRERRAAHVLARLGFVQALLGAEPLTLYRGAAVEGEPRRSASGAPTLAAAGSLISATFARAVAEAHFEGTPATTSALLERWRVPPERVLMTFLETRALNERYREAEAVLLG